MTTVYAVVGQHRTVPGLLLLRGDDNRYYAYAAGRPSPVEPTAAWALDADGQSGTDAAPVVDDPVSAPPAPDSAARRRGSWSALMAWQTGGWEPARTLAVALVMVLGAALGGPSALAHAPALATTAMEVALLAAPSDEARVLDVMPGGTEVELTGAAEGGFLEVSSGGRLGWAGAEGFDGGITTAAVVLDASLRAAPNADGEILGAVPAGRTVMLTGATVDGFVAASFAGIGGWLPVSAVA